MLFRQAYVSDTQQDLINDFVDWEITQINNSIMPSSRIIVSAKTGSVIEQEVNLHQPLNFDDYHYSYNEMLFRYFYVWDKSKFIKKQYC